jgi:hypothetical protein
VSIPILAPITGFCIVHERLPDVFRVVTVQRFYEHLRTRERGLGFLPGVHVDIVGWRWRGTLHPGIYVRLDENNFMKPDGSIYTLHRIPDEPL